MIRLILNVVHVSHCAYIYIKETIRTITDKIITWLCVRIVHFVSDFASKMACTICDMAKVGAINTSAKAKQYL